MNWNRQPRDECEAAAAAGDEGAQAAMRLHESIDRISEQLEETRASLQRLRESTHEELRRLRIALIEREKENT